VDQEVADLEEVRLLRQLLDGVPAVLEDALVAIDVGDGAAARGGVGEAGVIDGQRGRTLAVPDLSEVGSADGAVDDRDVVLQSGAVVTDGKRFCHSANLV